jgi:hypothetical protein
MWRPFRDLLPGDEDIPSTSPPVSFGQPFIAAHKEINRLCKRKQQAMLGRENSFCSWRSP